MNREQDGVIHFNLKTCDPLANFTRNPEALRLWRRLRKHLLPYLEEMQLAFTRLNPQLERPKP